MTQVTPASIAYVATQVDPHSSKLAGCCFDTRRFGSRCHRRLSFLERIPRRIRKHFTLRSLIYSMTLTSKMKFAISWCGGIGTCLFIVSSDRFLIFPSSVKYSPAFPPQDVLFRRIVPWRELGHGGRCLKLLRSPPWPCRLASSIYCDVYYNCQIMSVLQFVTIKLESPHSYHACCYQIMDDTYGSKGQQQNIGQMCWLSSLMELLMHIIRWTLVVVLSTLNLSEIYWVASQEYNIGTVFHLLLYITGHHSNIRLVLIVMCGRHESKVHV